MLIHFLLLFSLVFTYTTDLQTTKSKPDFTGTWNARIVADPNARIELLRISYNAPKLEISRILIEHTSTVVMGQTMNPIGARNFVYYTDGRGETQKLPVPPLSSDSAKSKTQRVGEKFITTESWTSRESGKKVTTDRTVTLEVSNDGATLIETTTHISEGNIFRLVRLYDRVSGNDPRNINGEWRQRNSNRLISLSVEHRDPEIKVTRRVVTDAQDETVISVYYTDGRGEINVKDGHQMKSVTKWKGRDLSFSLSRTSSSGGFSVNSEETIKWQISNGGQSLIEVTDTKMSSNKGFFLPQTPVKLIYARSASQLPE